MFAAARDVSDLKHAEVELQRYSDHLEDLVEERTSELKESEHQYRTLVETANSIICTVDTNGRFTFINDYGARFFDYTPDELIGKDVMTIIPEVESSGRKMTPYINAIVANPEQHGVSVNENITKDGTRVWVNWVNHALTDKEGKHIGHLAIGYDITEQVRTEKALRDAQRLAAIGQTATMIGHDLRNPLQALQLIVNLGEKYYNDLPPKAKAGFDATLAEKIFSGAEKQIQYMDKIVSDLQDYSRPLTLQPEEIQLEPFITDTFGLLTIPETINTNVNVTDSTTATIDPHLMQRVLSNLILNAVQAMPQGGELTVGATAEDHAVVITIQDTGEGVPETMKETLFSPLTTGKAKGTGLGLAVVKRIVEAHGGTIDFESEVGKGTTFTVTLPQTDS